MASKVNGIRLYSKRSIGCILSASFCVLVGLMIVLGLTFFPIFKAEINGVVSQANAFDYLAAVANDNNIDFLDSIKGFTHFLNSNAYNDTIFDSFKTFKNSAENVPNVAVSWYGSVYAVVDIVLGACYGILLVLGLYILIEGIVRLATGTYPKQSRAFTVISFFVMLLFVISSFITNFCIKYIALEVIGEGETYVAKACPLQYITLVILLLCWVGQYWVYVLCIKGRLYVANARRIKKHKEHNEEKEIDDFEEPKVKEKKSKKDKKVAEEVKEEAPAIVDKVEENNPPVEEAKAEETDKKKD